MLRTYTRRKKKQILRSDPAGRDVGPQNDNILGVTVGYSNSENALEFWEFEIVWEFGNWELGFGIRNLGFGI